MAERVHAGLRRAAGRRFGVTVGMAFIVLAALSHWRGHGAVGFWLQWIGIVLVFAGLLIPGWLGPVEQAWMALAHAISKVTTPIVMGIMYLGVLMPVGLMRRRFGGNPLVHEQHDGSFWRERPASARRSIDMRRQF